MKRYKMRFEIKDIENRQVIQFVRSMASYMSLVFLIMSFMISSCSGKQKETVKNDTNSETEQVGDLNDEEITDAIEAELIIQDGVNANKIDVVTSEGIVILTGSVDNILAKVRAKKIASMIKGVRGVINDISVEVSGISDEDVRTNATNALALDPATESYEIGMDVSDGKVNLKGIVDSWQEKQLAEKVVMGVDGVREIENNITFEYNENRPDEEIAEEVMRVLDYDVRVDDALVDVIVDENEVILDGTVGSLAEKDQAEIDAWVTGVKAVDVSNLDVAEWSRDPAMRENKYIERDDEELKAAIEDAFLYDARVLSFNIEAEVENGVATLKGVVDNHKAKQAAEQDARNVVGVWKVNNHIKVRSERELTDAQIKQNIESSLAWDPYVERFEIIVNVNNGNTYLSGTVDTYYEKFLAGDIASTTSGVERVNNNLVVEGNALPYVYDYDVHTYYPFWNRYYEAYNYTAEKSDMEIKEDIKEQVFWSPYINEEQIDVTVENGVARLTGRVDTWRERYYAEKNALEGGAIKVDNDIIVKSIEID